MSYDYNNNTYCSKCGSYGGCNCGYEYQCSSCSPDYNPVSANNSVCPSIEGSTGTGGNSTASGNNSTVNVSLCCDCGKSSSDCCRYGCKKLLSYLYNKSLDTINQATNICIYGDIIPDHLSNITDCQGFPLLSLTNADAIQNLSICDQFIKYGTRVVSMCAISIISFKFVNPNAPTVAINNNADLKKNFKYVKNCNCSCDCSDGISEALCFSGLGNKYDLRLQDVLIKKDDDTLSAPAIIREVALVAVDNNIAIFVDTTLANTIAYYSIPTCKIAVFSISPLT